MLRGDKPEPLSEDTVIEIAALIDKTGTDKTKVLKAYKVDSIEQLTADSAKHLIGVLAKRV